MKFNVFSAKSEDEDEDGNLGITTFFIPGEFSYLEAFGAYELITGEAMDKILETKNFMVVPADEVIDMNVLSEMISKSDSVGKGYLDDLFKAGNQLEPVETDEGEEGVISRQKLILSLVDNVVSHDVYEPLSFSFIDVSIQLFEGYLLFFIDVRFIFTPPKFRSNRYSSMLACASSELIAEGFANFLRLKSDEKFTVDVEINTQVIGNSQSTSVLNRFKNVFDGCYDDLRDCFSRIALSSGKPLTVKFERIGFDDDA